MPTAELLRMIRQHYRLSWWGIHGVVHWARVLENGERLAPLTGARISVVRFFAVFHDSQRINDDYDPDHGKRGAELARLLRGSAFDLSDEEFEILRTACTHHASGETEGDVTIQTCWDADRLDLGRVGIRPAPQRLCTEAAKDQATLSWAYRRSIDDVVPAIVEEWDSE